MNFMESSRPLGRTSLSLPILGIGCSPFGDRGRPISVDEVDGTVSAALEAGINYFDVAPYYGFGLAERRLGDVLRASPRDAFIISTKVGRILDPAPGLDVGIARNGFLSMMPFTARFDYSYEGVMRSFEASLHRLGLARIDILLVHDLGRFAHGLDHDRHFRDFVDGGYRALDELRTTGDIVAFGLGVNECAVCEDVMDHGRFDCFLLAGRYTLLEQGALGALLPRCEGAGTSVIVGGPYNSGLLAGGTRREGVLRYDYQPAPPDIIARVQAIENICATFGVTLAAAALQFPLAHPVVSCVIPGIGSAQRVAQTCALMQEIIPDQFWTTMREHGLIDHNAPVTISQRA